MVGLRYGSGYLVRKTREPRMVYWRGPSIGFDVGGNASKCFTLCYNLRDDKRLFQRFPGVEGSFYFVAGLGVNYQRSRRRHPGADPHRRRLPRRRECALSGLFRPPRLVPALGRQVTGRTGFCRLATERRAERAPST